MAAALRFPLILLLWGIMAVIYSPLVPAISSLMVPALSMAHWQALFSDPQLPQALLATLVSTIIAAAGALLIALVLVVALWPGARWQRLHTRLPWLMAVPHVAFATSALLLFAEGGAWYRILPFFTAPEDRYGVGLGLTLAVKESAFVMWILAALLSEKRLLQQVIVLDSLGYSRWQGLNVLLLPSVAPALGAVMLAIAAWSLSAVDVGIILGPGNPPTLAVLCWQWLNQGDAGQQVKGTLGSLLLILLLGALMLVGYLLWRGWRRIAATPRGVRHRTSSPLPGTLLSLLLPLAGVLCIALLAFMAQVSSINPDAFVNSLQAGLASSMAGLLVILLWLEWGPQRGHRWVWLPVILPALPLVAGQYHLALWFNRDGLFLTVIWGHLLWVLPWMLFALKPAWQRMDPRLILVAQTLGWSRSRIFCCVKCPLLVRPALLAFAVGFSVSIAQYMPTLWLGAGHFPTLTTEAVALTSGGSNTLLATQALAQLLLPLLVFALVALFSTWIGSKRQGLR